MGHSLPWVKDATVVRESLAALLWPEKEAPEHGLFAVE